MCVIPPPISFVCGGVCGEEEERMVVFVCMCMCECVCVRERERDVPRSDTVDTPAATNIDPIM